MTTEDQAPEFDENLEDEFETPEEAAQAEAEAEADGTDSDTDGDADVAGKRSQRTLSPAAIRRGAYRAAFNKLADVAALKADVRETLAHMLGCDKDAAAISLAILTGRRDALAAYTSIVALCEADTFDLAVEIGALPRQLKRSIWESLQAVKVVGTDKLDPSEKDATRQIGKAITKIDDATKARISEALAVTR